MEELAKAMYQLMWPALPWPEGRRYGKVARRSAEIAALRVLERTGYQQALDACHLLATEPDSDEAAWIAGAKTAYGLVDLVVRKSMEGRCAGDITTQ